MTDTPPLPVCTIQIFLLNGRNVVIGCAMPFEAVFTNLLANRWLRTLEGVFFLHAISDIQIIPTGAQTVALLLPPQGRA